MSVLDFAFYTFILIIAIQAFYYGFIFTKFAFSKTASPSKKNIAISVLICAKNEAENLKHFLPEIIDQDYPNFELILINDASLDDTLDVMQDFESKHQNIKVVDVKHNDKFWGNKKYALTLGIKASKHDFLLFTDADCRPVSNQWIKEMSSYFSNTKAIVIGYGGYKKIPKSIVNALVRYETFITAIQYFSYAKIGMPYMAVGRNLAYRKEVFFNVSGFTSHMKLPSGDDDLFINMVANNDNTALCFTKESFTESLPKTTLKDWINQKRRHLTTASFYKPKHRFLLGLFFISQLLFWSLTFILLINGFQWQVVIGFIIFRFIMVYLALDKSARKLNEVDLLLWIPCLEIFLIFMQLVIFISNLTSRPYRWK